MRLPFTGHFLGLVIWDAREPDETESTRSPPASPGVVPLAMTLLKQNCSDGQRGRVFGALGAVEGVAIVAGTLSAGLPAGALGIVPWWSRQEPVRWWPGRSCWSFCTNGPGCVGRAGPTLDGPYDLE